MAPKPGTHPPVAAACGKPAAILTWASGTRMRSLRSLPTVPPSKLFRPAAPCQKKRGRWVLVRFEKGGFHMTRLTIEHVAPAPATTLEIPATVLRSLVGSVAFACDRDSSSRFVTDAVFLRAAGREDRGRRDRRYPRRGDGTEPDRDPRAGRGADSPDPRRRSRVGGRALPARRRSRWVDKFP